MIVYIKYLIFTFTLGPSLQSVARAFGVLNAFATTGNHVLEPTSVMGLELLDIFLLHERLESFGEVDTWIASANTNTNDKEKAA